MEKESLLEIRNIIEDIKNNGIREEYISEIYKHLVYKDIPLNFNNRLLDTAHFTPKFNVISVNITRSKGWTKQVTKDALDSFEIILSLSCFKFNFFDVLFKASNIVNKSLFVISILL